MADQPNINDDHAGCTNHDVETINTCPDGGTCHHLCEVGRCFRVQCCGPLSGVFAGNQWPQHILRMYGAGEPMTTKRPAMEAMIEDAAQAMCGGDDVATMDEWRTTAREALEAAGVPHLLAEVEQLRKIEAAANRFVESVERYRERGEPHDHPWRTRWTDAALFGLGVALARRAVLYPEDAP